MNRESAREQQTKRRVLMCGGWRIEGRRYTFKYIYGYILILF